MHICVNNLKKINKVYSICVNKAVSQNNPMQTAQNLANGLELLGNYGRVNFCGLRNNFSPSEIKRIMSGIKGVSEDFYQKLGKANTLSEEVINDLESLKRGINIKEVMLPKLDNAEEVIACDIGQLVRMKGKNNILIKSRKGELKELGMDADMYLKLFPPVLRYSSLQKDLGNCYEITALNQMMRNPKTRENILGCFKQEGKDIIVKLPNGSIKEGIRFKNGELPNLVEQEKQKSATGKLVPNFYCEGADGMKLLQYTLGKDLEKDFLDIYGQKLNKNLLKDEFALAKEFGGDGTKTLSTELRDGNFATVVWSKMGFTQNGFIFSGKDKVLNDSKKKIDDWSYLEKYFIDSKPIEQKKVKNSTTKTDATNNYKSFIETINNPEFFKNNLVDCSTLPNSTIKKSIDDHSMSLIANFNKNGNIENYSIIDPNKNECTVVPKNKLIEYIDYITYAKID